MFMIFSRSRMRKLETPIDFARPESLIASICFQASSMVGYPGLGKSYGQ